MKLNKNKGFTLLEIIIVVIIVGVLASLALPRLFSTVEFSKSSEAMASFSSIRGSLDRCHLRKGTYDSCNDFTKLDIDDPEDITGAHFTYTIGSTSATEYQITATRTAFDSGNAGDYIHLHLNTAADEVQITGTGAFQNL